MNITLRAQSGTAATAGTSSAPDDVHISLPSDRCLAALSDAELVQWLERVFAAEQRLAAQRLALIAEIDGRGQPKHEGAP